jgi:hypothetical protein
MLATRSSDPVMRVRHDRSTSNLNRHVDRCCGKIAPDGQRINDFAHGSTYNKADFRYQTMLWVTQYHRPFVIVEDPPLQRMFKMLYAKVEIPSASTVSRDVKQAFLIAQKHVGKILQVSHTDVLRDLGLNMCSQIAAVYMLLLTAGHLQTLSPSLVLLSVW